MGIVIDRDTGQRDSSHSIGMTVSAFKARLDPFNHVRSRSRTFFASPFHSRLTTELGKTVHLTFFLPLRVPRVSSNACGPGIGFLGQLVLRDTIVC